MNDGQQRDAEEHAQQRAAAAGNGDAADDHGGDDLQFEAVAGTGIDLRQFDGAQHGGQTGERAHQDEHTEYDTARADADEPGGVGIGTGGVDGAAGGEIAHDDGEDSEDGQRNSDDDDLPGGLALAEPLEIGRKIIDPRRLRATSAALGENFHRGERDDDRRQTEPGDEDAVHRAEQRTDRASWRERPASIGTPDLASKPAATPQMESIEPMEISILREMMTSVMPMAATRTGALSTAMLRSSPGRIERRRRDLASTPSRTASASGDRDFTLEAGHQAAPAAAWPRASERMVSCVASARSRMPVTAPACMTTIAIAHAEDFGQLGRDHQDRQAAGGQIAHQAMDFGFRADVDALRGLVQNQEFRIRGQPARDGDFLLVAAGQSRRPALSSEAVLTARRLT